MYSTIEGTYQVGTLFGCGYVAEQHNEETQRWSTIVNERPFIDLDGLLKSLRSALSL